MVPHRARHVLVVDPSGRQRQEPVARVDELHRDLDVVVIVLEAFVEAAHPCEMPSEVALVRALQVEERVAARHEVAVEGRFDVPARLADTAADRILVLQAETGVVIDDAAHAPD